MTGTLACTGPNRAQNSFEDMMTAYKNSHVWALAVRFEALDCLRYAAMSCPGGAF